MKTRKLVHATLIVATLSVGAYAQNTPEKYFSDAASIGTTNLAKIEKQYAGCLQSDNEGVVESALAHVAMLKLLYPGNEFSLVQPFIDLVAARHSSQETRYKAYLVGTLMRNPGLFTAQRTTGYESPDHLFGALAGRMHELIASTMVE